MSPAVRAGVTWGAGGDGDSLRHVGVLMRAAPLAGAGRASARGARRGCCAGKTLPRVCRGRIWGRRLCRSEGTDAAWRRSAFERARADSTCQQTPSHTPGIWTAFHLEPQTQHLITSATNCFQEQWTKLGASPNFKGCTFCCFTLA